MAIEVIKKTPITQEVITKALIIKIIRVENLKIKWEKNHDALYHLKTNLKNIQDAIYYFETNFRSDQNTIHLLKYFLIVKLSLS